MLTCVVTKRAIMCRNEIGWERGRDKGRERDCPGSGFGWMRRVFQCLTGGQGNFTHACWLLTLAHGAGTVLQHITISIWHCLLYLMPTHTNTHARVHTTPDHTSQPQAPWEYSIGYWQSWCLVWVQDRAEKRAVKGKGHWISASKDVITWYFLIKIIIQ